MEDGLLNTTAKIIAKLQSWVVSQAAFSIILPGYAAKNGLIAFSLLPS